jgi:hypothetical protein
VIRTLRFLLALLVMMALTAPIVLAAQDGELQQLQRLRRATLEELADVARQLDDLTTRSGDADWVIVRAGDGSYVQFDLKRVDELVPWVQMARKDRGAAPGGSRRDPSAASEGLGGRLAGPRCAVSPREGLQGLECHQARLVVRCRLSLETDKT